MLRLRTPPAARLGGVLSALLLALLTLACSASKYAAYPYGNTRGPSVEDEIRFYEERVAQNPRGALDRAGLAEAYVAMAQSTHQEAWYDKAAEQAEASLRAMEFNNPGARLALAQVAEARHQFREAYAMAAQVLGQDGSNHAALGLMITTSLELGEVDRAAELAARLDEVQTAGALALRARVAEARGRDEEAVALYQAALAAEQPQERSLSARTRVQLGRVHLERGEIERARQAFEAALAIDPQQPAALRALGHLELRQNRPEAAADLFTAAFALTQDPGPLVELGMVHRARGDRAAADRVWQQAQLLLEETFASGHYGHGRDLALLYLERGRPEDVPKAVEVMEREVTIRRDPQTLELAARARRAATLRETSK